VGVRKGGEKGRLRELAHWGRICRRDVSGVQKGENLLGGRMSANSAKGLKARADADHRGSLQVGIFFPVFPGMASSTKKRYKYSSSKKKPFW